MNARQLASPGLAGVIRRALVMTVLVLLAPGAWVYAQVGGGFDLTWSSVAGGGASSTGDGGTVDLGGTAGQAATGSSSGGTFSVDSGFWVAQTGPVATWTPTSTPTLTLTPVPTSTPTITATATRTSTATSTPLPPQTILVGHVTWQGPLAQPNARQQLPVTLNLCVGGAPVSYAATTDSSGLFTVTVNLPAGTYNWRAKGSKYLGTTGTMAISSGGTLQVEMGLQRAGDTDATHNNVVNGQDFTALKNVFGTSSTTGDLNNDGVTTGTDFTLLKSNFGQAGQNFSCP